jgi:SAM-dependent methyltransferase
MRFKKIEGLDYKRGAIEYPAKLDPANRHHLLTKPFYNLANKVSRWQGAGIDPETQRHFGDFGNIAAALALEPGARILDVGCGSGWLCEYFARFGYEVTGIDISPALIELARERLQRVPFAVDHETELRYRFVIHDIENAPLKETFDAIVCYDALHHFENERAVLANLASMLDYGGQLFVLEGERPPAGSATEEELRSVMREYQTLESPFDRDYLLSLLQENGFAIAGDYIGINGLFERDSFDAGRVMTGQSGFNYLLCKKVSAPGPATMPDSGAPGRLSASITLVDELPRVFKAGERIEFSIQIVNTGDTLWLVSPRAPKGTVRLGIKIFDARKNLVEEFHGEPPLPRALAPQEKAILRIDRAAPRLPGRYTMKIDLIDQDICWFEERGSQPLAPEFEVD